jgi:ATP-binding cassette subfamily B protein
MPLPTPLTIRQSIKFRNVTFSYPGSKKPALQDFSLEIPSGKIVAIVGANGAGKTTLLKLLCRFYDPQSGQIEIDNTDIRQFSVKELWRRITVLFQFPLNYHATVAESISMGDVMAVPKASEIEAAARNAGVHDLIVSLPQAYQTLLGKVLARGMELSGGEWQRIAMARAYFSNAPIVLLDEPTSFMDSWAEADWFHRFRRLAKERTSVIITHRFTIAMRADTIHVMEAGHVVESGSHQDLLRRNGLYAKSWKAQMQATYSSDNEFAAYPYDYDPALQQAEA